VDEMPPSYEKLTAKVKSIFFELSWNEVYDLIEAIHRECEYSSNFSSEINNALKLDRSAYRIIDGIISPITSDQEIESIEAASSHEEPFSEHINSALRLLADRTKPDYRNSIKESISAVEAICFKISGSREFEKAIKILQTKIGLHGAMRSGFEKLYGYTSNDQGIRHALMDEASLEFEDAHFFLISCSAFVNYIICKMARLGLAPS